MSENSRFPIAMSDSWRIRRRFLRSGSFSWLIRSLKIMSPTAVTITSPGSSRRSAATRASQSTFSGGSTGRIRRSYTDRPWSQPAA
ncbi:MAG: hypothetical protein IPP07_13030 [Holophagales bacterium]|nr:hypothetical protein [Holophagales bacterium]